MIYLHQILYKKYLVRSEEMFGLFKKKEKPEESVKELELYAVADGELINIENVNDLVFAQKMMGDGYAILPDNGVITSPVEGKVGNVFPTKHAIGFEAHGLEVLLHMGIDTVSLDGGPFQSAVSENDEVTNNSVVSNVDLEKLKEADKDDVMIVIFTNGNDVIEEFNLTATGRVSKGQVIGNIRLK